MPRWQRRFLCSAVLCLLGLVFPESRAQQPGSPTNSAGILVVDNLGHGTSDLDGPWRFHLGDNPSWALTSLDDSSWSSMQVTAPWGAQGYPSQTGFAWYRRTLDLRPAAAPGHPYKILVPEAEDAYEVYWNGNLVGRHGRFPPHALWFYSQSPESFSLLGASSGVLAIRIWKAPLDIFSVAESGGLIAPPVVGDSDTISLNEQSISWTIIREDLFDYSLILLRTFITTLCAFLWFRDRGKGLYLWVAVFTLMPVYLGIFDNLFLIPFSYEVARCINQPIYALSNVSLWFLLLNLLEFSRGRRAAAITRILACFTLGAALADGLLALFWGHATLWMQWVDGLLSAFILVANLWPFVLIALGTRRRHDAARWAVTAAAFVSQLLRTGADASALGRRFTHWTLYERLIDNHQFQIQGTVFGPEKVSSLALFAAILYAAYRYILEQQARRTVLEGEMQSAQEIQRFLIPEELPSLPGYAITSAYTPAQEVGGDFFQIIAQADGSTVVVIGDVSGKGLKAAMNVSMILGVLRGQVAKTSDPVELMHSLNGSLVGRMQGGFATCVLFRLMRDGCIAFANAGHLPPFLNGQECMLEPSLPLGLSSYADYAETAIQMHPGDQLSLYTDGLLEAKNNTTGELYGFERLHTLFSGRPTAQAATEAAVAFGQDDDITVLTFTRLAAGEEPTIQLVTPNLEAVAARL